MKLICLSKPYVLDVYAALRCIRQRLIFLWLSGHEGLIHCISRTRAAGKDKAPELKVKRASLRPRKPAKYLRSDREFEKALS